MILIIGGAYQGKSSYAKETYHLTEADFFHCTGSEIDFSKKCIASLQEFTFQSPDPVAYFEENRPLWQDKILIMQDISCGVVPMGVENRAWRQKNGQLSRYLAQEATSVIRIFCGLEQVLK